MLWRALGDTMIVAHFAFLAYLLFGGFLAWRRPRSIYLHMSAAVWGVLIVTTKVPCPLTWAQNEFREHGGQHRLPGGFIEAYVTGHLYPTDRARLTQLLVAVLVLGSWLGFAVRMRRAVGGDDVRAASPTGRRRTPG